jgi:hypothetical protein
VTSHGSAVNLRLGLSATDSMWFVTRFTLSQFRLACLPSITRISVLERKGQTKEIDAKDREQLTERGRRPAPRKQLPSAELCEQTRSLAESIPFLSVGL